MSKKVLLILSILVLSVSISLYFIGRDYIVSKSFEDLLGRNETEITKVFMRNGGNGSAVSTEDKNEIKKLISSINDRKYRKSFDQRPRTGYSYYYTFYIGDKAALTITGTGSYVNISGVYYEVDREILSNESRNGSMDFRSFRMVLRTRDS